MMHVGKLIGFGSVRETVSVTQRRPRLNLPQAAAVGTSRPDPHCPGEESVDLEGLGDQAWYRATGCKAFRRSCPLRCSACVWWTLRKCDDLGRWQP